ncbi:MAG: GNAT family N-acetyltransferase [Clostridia bacterium]|nr:GNAT family N-acetyltransferase [Clostridia bacterium]
MEQETLRINGIPAVVYGSEADGVFLFVHGKNGNKEEAEDFAQSVSNKDWQVLGVDLPEHGARQAEKDTLKPWLVIPELRGVMQYAKQRWQRIGLRANSIGAWFSMLSFAGEALERCLFVSPILDMERLIIDMTGWAGVSEAQLQEQGEIGTSFGETLSWRYLEFARQHPIADWNAPTAILYAGKDTLTARETAEAFAKRFHCDLSIMENGEHWFHTPEQMEVLHSWTDAQISRIPKSTPAEAENVTLRFAAAADSAALRDIYAQYIDTTITFEYALPTEAEFARRIDDVMACYPYLVCEQAGKVIGYAYAHRHREREAYQWNAELSVYLAPSHRGKGLGKMLFHALLGLLRLQGVKTVYSGVAMPNEASEGLHASMGFSRLGTYHNTGYKCGGWHDVTWFEKQLNALDASPAPILPINELSVAAVGAVLESAARGGASAHLSK